MENYKKALEFAKQNPSSSFANEFRRRIESGEINPNDYKEQKEDKTEDKKEKSYKDFSAFGTAEEAKERRKGVNKYLGEMVVGMSTLGEKAIKSTARFFTPKSWEKPLGIEKTKKSSAEKLRDLTVGEKGFEATNKEQKQGKIGAEIATFMSPTNKINRIEKTLGWTGKNIKSILGRSALEGGLGVSLGTVQEGGFGEKAKTEGAWGAGTSLVLGTAGKAYSVAKKFISPESNQAIIKAVKPYITKKRKLNQVQETLDKANKELINQGYKPNDLKSYSVSLESAKKNVWSKVEKILKSGENKKIDYYDIGTKISDYLSKNKGIEIANPQAKKKIIGFAQTLMKKGETDVLEAENLKQFLNAELNSAYGSFNLSSVEKNVKKLVNHEIGQQLDRILSKVPNEFADLKKTWGALKETQEDVMKRMLVFQRQNPTSLFEGLGKMAGVGDIVKGITTANPLAIVQGVSEISMGRMIKKANDSDELIKRGFKQLHQKIKGTQRADALLKRFGVQEGQPEQTKNIGNAIEDVSVQSKIKKAKAEGKSILREGQKEIGENFNSYNNVARERFNIPELEKISFGGSDRDVYNLGNDKALKVSKTARGLAQNASEGELYAPVPKVFEVGDNYVVTELAEKPNAITKELVKKMNEFKSFGGRADEVEMLQKTQQYFIDKGEDELVDIIGDLMNYEIMINDITSIRNWGTIDDMPVLVDAGSLNRNLLDDYDGIKNLNDTEFYKTYIKSKEAKKKFGDLDKKTMYGIGGLLLGGGYASQN